MLTARFGSSAEKFMKKCETILRTRLIERIERLQEEPFPTDAKRIQGRTEKLYRIRVGDYRILYLVESEKKEIFISEIDKRSRIYE